MNIAFHLCGTAIAYEPLGGGTKTRAWLPGMASRPQGSLFNQQKRAIADAVEWIRINGKEKPLILVATSPGYTHASNERKIISTFTHNLRNGYGVQDYVWVRELTRKGFPHFHFVVSKNWIDDPVRLSRYWSGLFDLCVDNAVRLGSKPDSSGKRQFYIKNKQHAHYLGKYLGKGLNQAVDYLIEGGFPIPPSGYRKTFRQFGISQEVRERSMPKIYEANYSFHQTDEMVLSGSGKMVQKPATCIGRSFRDKDGNEFNPHNYTWKQVNPMHAVYFGSVKTVKPQLELNWNRR